ncbi:MAG TPA: hypothetical protein H9699_09455 [Candidatus Gemmiger stercoravium]|nr:hypothetical protein [Candidatus Gemmiger stercoravium]
MYAVTEAYQQAIRAPVRTERLRGTLTLTDGTVRSFGPESLMSGSVTLDTQCVNGQELEFGCVYLGQASFQLRTDLSRYKLYGARVSLTYGLRLPDGSWADLPLGVYTVAEAERTNLCVSIHAYDNLLLLDRDYTGPALQGTPYGMLSQIAEHCGLELGVTEADLAGQPNAAETFQLDTQDGCATWRDCLAAVAQVTGCFGAVDRAGALVLRPFGAQPCATLGTGDRAGAAVADYVCRYTALVVETGGRRLVSRDPDDAGGLTMTITDAPLFAKGLAERAQALADALFAHLQTLPYVPASLTGVADPALDCGDRLTITEPGEASGQTSAQTLVTHRVWKFRGSSTLKGVGKNPYLAAARDKGAAALQQLQTDTVNNRLIFYSFVNPAAVTAGPGAEVTAARVTFVTVEKTGALFFAQLLVNAEPDAPEPEDPDTGGADAPADTGGQTGEDTGEDAGEDAGDGGESAAPAEPPSLLLEVRYYLNGSPVTGFAPVQRLTAGPRILALFYPFTELEADTSNRFEVRLAVTGGTVTLAAGGLRGVITGQGMAGGPVWDGTLQAEDALGPAAWQRRPLTAGPLQDQPALHAAAPASAAGRDTLPALAWAPAALVLQDLQAESPAIQQEEV